MGLKSTEKSIMQKKDADYFKYQVYLPHHKDADDLGYVHDKELWQEKYQKKEKSEN